MKNVSIFAVAALALTFGASCVKKATPAECKAACQKKAGFTEPAKPVEDPIAKVEADFGARFKAIQKKQLDAVTAIEKERQEKLAEAGTEGKRKALEEEYAARKAEAAKSFAPKFAELSKLKADAMNAAREAKARAEAALKAAAEKLIADCADKCVRDRITKEVVDCRLAATSLEEFGKCK